MKFILILIFFVPTSGTIQSVTTAEFDDLAACNTANSAATKMAISAGQKNSVAAECLPKGAMPTPGAKK